jgi:chorismate mutase
MSGTQAHYFRAGIWKARTRPNTFERIGEWKRAKNVKPFRVARWRALLADRMDRAGAQGLDEEYVKAIFEVIHRESVLRQSQIMDEGESSGT